MSNDARTWWNRHKDSTALTLSLLSLFVAAWSSCTSNATASDANKIQAQLRDLQARVDLNLVSAKSDYIKGSTPGVVNFSIELSNAGPGVASRLTFGIGLINGDPVGRALAVNAALDGTVVYPYSLLAQSSWFSDSFMKGYLGAAAGGDPAKLVTVWVRYTDTLDRPFIVEFAPDSHYRNIQPCLSLSNCPVVKDYLGR